MLRKALPGTCAFCLSPSIAGVPWCAACFEVLPWNRHTCAQCANPLPATMSGLCGRCLRHPPAFTQACVGLRYEGEVAALMQRFKFSADPRAATVLLTLMQTSLAQTRKGEMPQALIALPRHVRRARERGFDQAEWLTRRLARDLRLTCYPARRLRATPTQRGLDREARRRNLKEAFVVDSALPTRVAIVDDIMTTGASLDALARACLAAGATQVEAWAVARTP